MTRVRFAERLPHPEDKEFCISQGEDYWEPKPINADISLHDLWHKYERNA